MSSRFSWLPVLLLSFPWLILSACSSTRSGTGVPSFGDAGSRGEAGRSFTILGINDFYNIEGTDGGQRGGMARLRTLRRELEKEHPDLLVLHAGDLLSPSLLSRRFRGEQMIDLLNVLDGDDAAFDERLFITFGNHEFDRGKLEHAGELDQRIDESAFRWLESNIDFSRDGNGRPLVDGANLGESYVVESGGVRVGLFGLTIDTQPAEYIDRFEDPQTVARRLTRELRDAGAEVVVALTHLRAIDDVAMLEALGDDGPDLVIGGHEHERLQRQIGRRWVLKADSDVRSASVVRVTLVGSEPPRVDYRYAELGPQQPIPDRAVKRRTRKWLKRLGVEFCSGLQPPEGPDCIDQVLGRTGTRLLAEELDIRRFETNLGNWMADQALASMAHHGAQVAFLNSGSLRLNQSLPAGIEITRRHLEALLPFPSKLELLRITGADLQQAMEHSVRDWVGNGYFAQVAGFAFRHDGQGKVEGLTLLNGGDPRPIDPDEELLVVVSEFLADPGRGQDGYDMLKPELRIEIGETIDLKQEVIEALAAAEADGIAPRVEGRICLVDGRGPCLAQ